MAPEPFPSAQQECMGVIWGGYPFEQVGVTPSLKNPDRFSIGSTPNPSRTSSDGSIPHCRPLFPRGKAGGMAATYWPPLLYVDPIALSGVDLASLRTWGGLIGLMAVGKMMPLGTMREASFVGISPNGSPAQEDPVFVAGQGHLWAESESCGLPPLASPGTESETDFLFPVPQSFQFCQEDRSRLGPIFRRFDRLSFLRTILLNKDESGDQEYRKVNSSSASPSCSSSRATAENAPVRPGMSLVGQREGKGPGPQSLSEYFEARA